MRKCRGHSVFLSGVAIVRQDDKHDEIHFILRSLLVGSCMNREGGFYVQQLPHLGTVGRCG